MREKEIKFEENAWRKDKKFVEIFIFSVVWGKFVETFYGIFQKLESF